MTWLSGGSGRLVIDLAMTGRFATASPHFSNCRR
jgi:hypothetical protein